MKKAIVTTIMAALSALPLFSLDLELNVSGNALKVLTSKEAPEGFGRGLPMGPASLRFVNNSLWAVDSIAGRFVEFNAQGQQQKFITVENADQLVISDFAFENDTDGRPVAIWAVGTEQPYVLKTDMTGKVLASFSTDLSFPAQLELLSGGNLAISDQSQKNISIYNTAGQQVWRHEIVGKSFVAETNGDLLFLTVKGENVAVMKRLNATGELVEYCELPMSEDSNPALLFSRDGEIFFGFHSEEEESEEYVFNINRFSLASKTMATLTTAFPAPFINRLLLENNGNLLLVSFVDENGRYLLRLNEFVDDMISEDSEG